MSIANSDMYDDVVNIISNRADVSDTRFKYTLELVAADTLIGVTKIHTIDITRDFVSRYGDYMTMVISLNRLQYDDLIYPNRHNLVGILTVESVHDKTGTPGGEKATQQYRVKLTESKDDKFIFADTLAEDDNAKAQELKELSIQLIDLNLEKLRVKEVVTVVRDTSVNDLLHVIMSDKGEFKVDIYPPDKEAIIRQLVVGGQETISIADFPSWLQKFGGGVYNHNIGFYCYNGWVYVYPLYRMESDPKRRKLTICNIGPGQLTGIDNTYSVEPGKLSIISSGDVEMVDTTDNLSANLGNAVRFNLPNFLKDGIHNSEGVCTRTGNGLNIHGVNNEVINNVKTYNQITNNPFYEVSRVASNRGVRASLTWENANPALIYPNMEVTVLYKSGSNTYSMRGVVIGMDYQSQVGENEGNNQTHTGNAILHLNLDNTVK